MADYVLTVCEKINSRPPRFLGTALLIGLYLFSLAAAVLGLSADVLARRDKNWEMGSQLLNNPPYLYSATNSLQSIKAKDTHVWIVISSTNETSLGWVDEVLSKSKYERLADGQLASSRFILISTNAAKKTAAKLRSAAFQHPGSYVAYNRYFGSYFTGSWKFDAPNESVAGLIVDDLKTVDLLQLNSKLMAPWDKSAQLSEAHRQSRRQWLAMSQAEQLARSKSYKAGLAAWKKKGQPEKDRPIFATDSEISESIPRYMTNFQGTLDTNLLVFFQHFTTQTNRNDDDEVTLHDPDVLNKLGVLSESPEGRDIVSMSARRQGREVTITSITYSDLPEGFKAMGSWLANQGCTNIHYSIIPMGFGY